MNNENTLVDKIIFGAILGFESLFVYSLINFAILNGPKDYGKYSNIKTKIEHFESIKRNSQKVNLELCSKDLERNLDGLYFKKNEFENTQEYKIWEKECSKNSKYAFFGMMGTCFSVVAGLANKEM